MALALFDLDNTLLGGDSDYLWGCFLVEKGIVGGEHYERENARFFGDYRLGQLDIRAFLRFSLAPLAQYERVALERMRQQFVAEKIQPVLLPAACALLAHHRAAGDTVVIVTATNHFVSEKTAEVLGVQHLIATDLEECDGHFTGEVRGIPCFREGKIARVEAWAAQHAVDWSDSWFYSDSHNDLPLLERVDHPVAVDPDPTLAALARARDWPIISLR